MLRTRVLTALVGIPLALAVVFAPGGGLMAFALSLLALLGALEYRRAYLHADWIPQPRPNLILLLAGASSARNSTPKLNSQPIYSIPNTP